MSARRRLPQDPDEIRMSFGDHLDELRSCLIRALLGLIAAVAFCFHFGDRIIGLLTAPYYAAMQEAGFEPRLVQLNPIESFTEYVKVAVECGLVLAAPWGLYQLWRFVAVGLYPGERKIVRWFAPTSMGLFVVGASFLIVMVLFGLLKFLIGIAAWFPMPAPEGNWLTRYLDTRARPVTTRPAAPPQQLPVLNEPPPNPRHGDAWISRPDNSLNVQVDGQRYTISLRPAAQQQFVQPFFSISHYLGFVTGMCLAFGLGFQVPIVVVFLITTGIVPAERMSAARRYVILGIAVAAAFITPTPDVATMMLLAVPMVVLFESGLLIGRLLARRKAAEA